MNRKNKYAACLLAAFAILTVSVQSASGQISFVDETSDYQWSPPVADPEPVPEPEPASEPVPEPEPETGPIASDGGPGFVTPITLNLEMRLLQLEQRMTSVEGRVKKVEDQLRALVTLRKSDGSSEQKEVEISTVKGYGDFEVPKGAWVTHVNGVPVSRSSQTVNGRPAYSTPSYNASVAKPNSRVIRLAPRNWSRSSSTCTIDPRTGRRICN